jgi:hypothetical protein
MKRTSITLPDELAALLDREARRRETSVSGLVRDLVETALGVGKPRELQWAGMIDDPGMAPAAKLDEELGRHWADAIRRDR